MVKFFTKRGRKLKGRKAALLRAKLHHDSTAQDLPLEISLYIVRFSFRWSKILFLNDTPEFIYCRASKPQIYRCSHYLYAPFLTLKGFEVTDSLYRPANLILALNQLVDALTGLERILTTPIPYSSVLLCSQNRQYSLLLLRYSIHLWTVTVVYCFFLVGRHVSVPTWFVY